MSTTLAQEQIIASLTTSLENLEEFLSSGNYIAMLIDIDLLPINNRMIRQLTLKYPGVSFLCVSAYRFHPDLRDALCYHIYACIQKPEEEDLRHILTLLEWIG